jgi:hypothetical protein
MGDTTKARQALEQFQKEMEKSAQAEKKPSSSPAR